MTNRSTNGRIAVVVMMLLSALVAGCVTTTDSPFSREADERKAVENYVQLATAYIGQGNLERARHHLDRALELDPDSPAAQAALGLIYNSEGETELAESSFKRAISRDPDYTRGRVYYGAFLYSQGRMKAARDQFSVASRDTGYQDRGSVFFNLGMTQEQLGETDAAVASYRRAVELTRGDAKSLLALSRVLADKGKYDAASLYFSRLTKVMQKNSRLRHSPESLLTGIRIARYQNDRDLEASLALQLRNNFPESAEYRKYKVLISNGQ